jgi:hypothetical protein
MVIGAAATLAIIWLNTNGGGPNDASVRPEGAVRVVADGKLVRRVPAAIAAAPVERLRRELELPSQMIDVRGPARITYDIDVGATARRIAEAGGETVIQVARRPIASAIAVPRVRARTGSGAPEALLMVISAGRGQASARGAADLAPGASRQDLMRGAAQAGVQLRDLTGIAGARLYDRLLLGRLVIAWVAASGAGGDARGTMRPGGDPTASDAVAVVLRGVRTDGALRIANPRNGALETWAREDFEVRWRRAGSWALGA